MVHRNQFVDGTAAVASKQSHSQTANATMPPARGCDNHIPSITIEEVTPNDRFQKSLAAVKEALGHLMRVDPPNAKVIYEPTTLSGSVVAGLLGTLQRQRAEERKRLKRLYDYRRFLQDQYRELTTDYPIPLAWFSFGQEENRFWTQGFATEPVWANADGPTLSWASPYSIAPLFTDPDYVLTSPRRNAAQPWYYEPCYADSAPPQRCWSRCYQITRWRARVRRDTTGEWSVTLEPIDHGDALIRYLSSGTGAQFGRSWSVGTHCDFGGAFTIVLRSLAQEFAYVLYALGDVDRRIETSRARVARYDHLIRLRIRAEAELSCLNDPVITQRAFLIRHSFHPPAPTVLATSMAGGSARAA